MPVPNLLNELKALRAQYPDLISVPQAVDILNRLSIAHPGFGLHKKTGGNHGTLPNGVPVSVDYLLYKDTSGVWGTDVLGSAPDLDPPKANKASATWSGWHLVSDPENFVPPSNVAPQPQPEPKPEPQTPPPATVDLSVVLAKLDAMQAAIDELRSRPPAPVVFPKYAGKAKLGLSMTFEMEPEQ